MFEFRKLCHEVENLTPQERTLYLTDKSISVVKGLKELGADDVDPVIVLVSFLIGSVVSDGTISEKDYLFIYPSLQKAFGDVCDLSQVKYSVKVAKDIQKEISNYTQELISLISLADENLKSDLVLLCLLITSVDGKVSLKEKKYIKQLCKA